MMVPDPPQARGQAMTEASDGAAQLGVPAGDEGRMNPWLYTVTMVTMVTMVTITIMAITMV